MSEQADFEKEVSNCMMALRARYRLVKYAQRVHIGSGYTIEAAHKGIDRIAFVTDVAAWVFREKNGLLSVDEIPYSSITFLGGVY